MAGFGFGNVGFVGSLSTATGGGAVVATPTPLLRYRAADVTGTTWANSGSSGAAHDMVIVGAAQLVAAASGGSPQNVRFDGAGYYQSGANVPATLLFDLPRTIGLRLLLENPLTTVNLLGYGVNSGLQMVDLFNDGSKIVAHYNGAGANGSATAANVWMDIALDIESVAGSIRATFYRDGVASPADTDSGINTQPSKLRLGVGTYPPLDNTARFRLAGVWVIDRVCTPAEITQLFTTL